MLIFGGDGGSYCFNHISPGTRVRQGSLFAFARSTCVKRARVLRVPHAMSSTGSSTIMAMWEVVTTRPMLYLGQRKGTRKSSVFLGKRDTKHGWECLMNHFASRSKTDFIRIRVGFSPIPESKGVRCPQPIPTQAARKPIANPGIDSRKNLRNIQGRTLEHLD